MKSSQRIQSVDILRGITILAMILVNTPGTWNHVYSPLLHAEWHGLTPTDLIFPFFLFIVGISISFAYGKKIVNNSTYKKIFVRSLKLIGLGLILNLFLPYYPFIDNLETFRIPGVLQRIGIVFFISSILFLKFNWKTLLGIAIFILISYWVLLGFIPLFDGAQPTFDRAINNWSNYVDLKVFGSHMWKVDYDPEGLLGTVPSIATCLSGILIGLMLKRPNPNKLTSIFIIGVLLLIAGYTIDIWFPINKAIWSSSFVLVSSGWAIIILSIIYFFTDVLNIKFGTIFKYIGMNAITIYFLSGFISKSFYLTKISNETNIHSWLYNSLFKQPFFSENFSSLLYAIVVAIFYSFLGYYLYKKKIFIKV